MRKDFVKYPFKLVVPDRAGADVGFAGKYHVKHIRHGNVIDEFDFDNIITNQGLDYILGVSLTGVTQIPSWYVAPFEGNYVPVATDTAATIVANATENTTYSSSTRAPWVGVEAAQQASNSASVATFTFVLTPPATKTIYGAMLISSSAKSSVSGTLLSAAQFATPKIVGNTDQLLFTYTIVGSSI